ncbi:MAG: DUF4340 domain-containing protein [Deltaproteobacteria bacterium]|nr:MAG: DUF4340 domain-containing protein [Deltaproteobacteria bacterium]
MSRQVYVLGALLVVALVLSYLSWTHKPVAGRGDRTEVVSVSPEEVQRIRYSSEKNTVTLEAKKDALGTYYEVTVATPAKGEGQAKAKEAAKTQAKEEGAAQQEKAEAATPETKEPASPDGESGTPAQEGTPPMEVKHFVSTSAAGRVVKKLAPLLAYRVLEHPDDERLAKLGLAESKERLVLEKAGRTWTFDVGGRTYGAARRYLRDAESGRVYLVDGSPLRTLQNAERTLIERKLFDMRRSEIERVTVRRGEKTVTMVQQHRDDRAKAYWAREEAPQKKIETWRNWIDKLFGLQAREYREEEPANLEPVVTVVVEGDGPQETLTLYRTRPEPSTAEAPSRAEEGDGEGHGEKSASKASKAGAAEAAKTPPAEEAEVHYFARSSNTRALVKVDDRLAEEVAADLDGVFNPAS